MDPCIGAIGLEVAARILGGRSALTKLDSYCLVMSGFDASRCGLNRQLVCAAMAVCSAADSSRVYLGSWASRLKSLDMVPERLAATEEASRFLVQLGTTIPSNAEIANVCVDYPCQVACRLSLAVLILLVARFPEPMRTTTQDSTNQYIIQNTVEREKHCYSYSIPRV